MKSITLAKQGLQYARSNGPLLSLLAIGLGIRMAIAPHGGFPNDLSFDGNLADQLAKGNPIVIPGPPLFVHWPYLYVLFVISHIAHLFGAVPTPWWLLKLPGVLGDLALALSVTRLVGKVSSGTIEVLAKLRLWGAALILFNPAIIFVSAVWGQADSLIAFLALEAFLLLFTGRQIWWREGLGWFLFTIAIADKPQLVVIFPLVFVVAWGRTLGAHNHGLAHLHVAGLRVVGHVALSMGLVVAAIAPFGLGLGGVITYYLSFPTNSVTSANGFNFWGAIAFWQNDSGPGRLTIAGVPALYVGLFCFVLAISVLAQRLVLAKRYAMTDIQLVLIGTGAIICIAFALLTREHERYLYMALPCFTIFLTNRKMRIAVGALTGWFFLNLYYSYAFFVAQAGEFTPHFGPLFNWVYGTTQDSLEKKVISAITACTCLLIALRSAGWFSRDASQMYPKHLKKGFASSKPVAVADCDTCRGSSKDEKKAVHNQP